MLSFRFTAVGVLHVLPLFSTATLTLSIQRFRGRPGKSVSGWFLVQQYVGGVYRQASGSRAKFDTNQSISRNKFIRHHVHERTGLEAPPNTSDFRVAFDAVGYVGTFDRHSLLATTTSAYSAFAGPGVSSDTCTRVCYITCRLLQHLTGRCTKGHD